MLNFYKEDPDANAFIDEFLNPDSTRPKYVFGTNHEAFEISKKIDLQGFVDDLKDDDSFNGLPVIRSNNLPKNSLVVIVALMRPLTLHNKLKNLGIDHIHYISLLRFSKLNLSQPWFWEGFDHDFRGFKKFYQFFDEALSDQQSIDTYYNLINFRLTGNIKFLEGFSDLQDNQYFEPFLKFNDGDSFVDIGGFDGKTAIAYSEINKNFSFIYFFEPENNNMKIAKKTCHNLANVVYLPYGVSDKNQTLGIKVGGSTSKVVSRGQGDYDVELRKLDDVMGGHKVNFIKMDIEGAEISALIGAEQIIKNQKPQLAICVYHHGSDIRRIYQLVKTFNPDYRCYLRHYTEGIVETVMFFI